MKRRTNGQTDFKMPFLYRYRAKSIFRYRDSNELSKTLQVAMESTNSLTPWPKALRKLKALKWAPLNGLLDCLKNRGHVKYRFPFFIANYAVSVCNVGSLLEY